MKSIYRFFYPKDTYDLIKNIGYNLKKIDKKLNNPQKFRNKCSIQSLKILIKISEKDNTKIDNKIGLFFKLLEKYYSYWE